jgi:hypothetical protein
MNITLEEIKRPRTVDGIIAVVDPCPRLCKLFFFTLNLFGGTDNGSASLGHSIAAAEHIRGGALLAYYRTWRGVGVINP